jgi:hypothetical protein
VLKRIIEFMSGNIEMKRRLGGINRRLMLRLALKTGCDVM